MILALDIGNSCITFGGFLPEGECPLFVARIATDLAGTQDEYAVRLSSVLSLHGIAREEITGVIAASVVPPLNAVLRGACAFLFGQEPLFVGPGIKTGIGIRCDIPSSVGADLIAAAVAAYGLYGGPALVVDVSTATSLTVINAQGAFIGTAIAPGLYMGLDALSKQTAQLSRVSLEVPPTVIGKNTADCMRSGVLYGHAALIDGMIDRICEEYGEALPVYVTGGGAQSVVGLCRHSMTADANLVLKGLRLLYLKNRV